MKKLILVEKFHNEFEKVAYLFLENQNEYDDAVEAAQEEGADRVRCIVHETHFSLGYKTFLEDEEGRIIEVLAKDEIRFWPNGSWQVKRHVPWWKKPFVAPTYVGLYTDGCTPNR